MSTKVVPKRSARLRSRNSPVKSVAETKSRPKKVVTVNKSIQKINVSARRLRPRGNKQNYRCKCCDDSKLLQKHVPAKQHDSIVVLEKLDLEKKVPIYKTLGYEKSSEEASDVYDFKFDANDTKEKLKKKKRKLRKKATNTKTGSKVTKKGRAKKKIELSKTIAAIKESESKKEKDAKKIETPEAAENIPTTKESQKKDVDQIEIPTLDTDTRTIKETVGEEDIVEATETSRTEMDIQVAEEQPVREDTVDRTVSEAETSKTDAIIEKTLPVTTVESNQTKKQIMIKPKIVSVENADNIIVKRSLSSNTKNVVFQPFRQKNIFDNQTADKQSKNTLNSSTLMQSVSPITKISNNLDLGSPWRPPMVSMFSQARHFIQSTPNVSMEINDENAEQNKENLEVNKKNKYRKNKENVQKMGTFRRKYLSPKQIPAKQNINTIQAMFTNQAAKQPCRISFGEIKALLQNDAAMKEPDNGKDDELKDDKEADKSLVAQNDKHLEDYLNFSDTFDVMSETEKLSSIPVDVPLFVDLEPSHFSKPPRHSYKRKHCVKFDLMEDGSEDEEERKNAEKHAKRKKITKTEKEHQKRVNEWVKSVNTTFDEIDNYDLLIE